MMIRRCDRWVTYKSPTEPDFEWEKSNRISPSIELTTTVHRTQFMYLLNLFHSKNGSSLRCLVRNLFLFSRSLVFINAKYYFHSNCATQNNCSWRIEEILKRWSRQNTRSSRFDSVSRRLRAHKRIFLKYKMQMKQLNAAVYLYIPFFLTATHRRQADSRSVCQFRCSSEWINENDGERGREREKAHCGCRWRCFFLLYSAALSVPLWQCASRQVNYYYGIVLRCEWIGKTV